MLSIRMRLLSLVLTTLVVIWILVTSFTWWRADTEIHKVFDAQLAQIARLLAIVTLHETAEQHLDVFARSLKHREYEFPVIFQVWAANGELLVRGPGAPAFPLSAGAAEGYSDADFNGEPWRVFTLPIPAPGSHIQVAHAHRPREASIMRFVLDVLTPLLFTLPLLGVLWFGIDRGLAPLSWVARQISGRDHSNLIPVSGLRVPPEIAPLVDEINALFLRLDGSIQRYSRFSSNVAHELRNPLAGVMTQAQVALASRSEDERLHALQQVVRGLRRLSRMVEQMLTLARIEPESLRGSFSRLDMNALAAETLANLSHKALEKGVDIALLTDGPASVNGNEELLGVLLGNLLDNAIRATPSGGKVEVQLEDTPGGVRLRVADTGPGIPEAERERVFDRFRRLGDVQGPGSGLGLSIVRAIASVHGAAVALSERAGRPGLLVTVQFPAGEPPLPVFHPAVPELHVGANVA